MKARLKYLMVFILVLVITLWLSTLTVAAGMV